MFHIYSPIPSPLSTVKCQVDAIGNVQSGICSFVPTDRLLISRDYPSSCIFISNFRAHAHYSISISIDFTLYTRVRQQDRNECCQQHWGDMCLRSPHSLTHSLTKFLSPFGRTIISWGPQQTMRLKARGRGIAKVQQGYTIQRQYHSEHPANCDLIIS